MNNQTAQQEGPAIYPTAAHQQPQYYSHWIPIDRSSGTTPVHTQVQHTPLHYPPIHYIHHHPHTFSPITANHYFAPPHNPAMVTVSYPSDASPSVSLPSFAQPYCPDPPLPPPHYPPPHVLQMDTSTWQAASQPAIAAMRTEYDYAPMSSSASSAVVASLKREASDGPGSCTATERFSNGIDGAVGVDGKAVGTTVGWLSPARSPSHRYKQEGTPPDAEGEALHITMSSLAVPLSEESPLPARSPSTGGVSELPSTTSYTASDNPSTASETSEYPAPSPASLPLPPPPTSVSTAGTEETPNSPAPATASRRTRRQSKAQKRFTCHLEECGKSFTTSGHLARHARIHTGQKPFQCLVEGCTSRFSRQDNMMQHYRSHQKKLERCGTSSLMVRPPTPPDLSAPVRADRRTRTPTTPASRTPTSASTPILPDPGWISSHQIHSNPITTVPIQHTQYSMYSMQPPSIHQSLPMSPQHPYVHTHTNAYPSHHAVTAGPSQLYYSPSSNPNVDAYPLPEQ